MYVYYTLMTMGNEYCISNVWMSSTFVIFNLQAYKACIMATLIDDSIHSSDNMKKNNDDLFRDDIQQQIERDNPHSSKGIFMCHCACMHLHTYIVLNTWDSDNIILYESHVPLGLISVFII